MLIQLKFFTSLIGIELANDKVHASVIPRYKVILLSRPAIMDTIHREIFRCMIFSSNSINKHCNIARQ